MSHSQAQNLKKQDELKNKQQEASQKGLHNLSQGHDQKQKVDQKGHDQAEKVKEQQGSKNVIGSDKQDVKKVGQQNKQNVQDQQKSKAK